MRDAGIIQVYVENNQEAHDLIPQAYKIAENSKVLLPFMVCMDGFKLTHAYEPVNLHTQEMIDEFLPPYEPVAKLSVEKPLTFGAYAPPHIYMEFRVALQNAMERARKVIEDVFKEWAEFTKRDWSGHIAAENVDGAETAVVTMGSITSLVRDVIEELRKEGKKVGLIKLRTFRPFPNDEIKKALEDVNKVIVIERAVSFGNEGQVAIEIKNALYGGNNEIYSFAVGLGGRDVPRELIVKIIDNVMKGKVKQGFYFEGVHEFREVIP